MKKIVTVTIVLLSLSGCNQEKQNSQPVSINPPTITNPINNDTGQNVQLFSNEIYASTDWEGKADIVSRGESVEISDSSSSTLQYRKKNLGIVHRDGNLNVTLKIEKPSDSRSNAVLLRIRHLDDSTDVKQNLVIDPATGSAAFSGGAKGNVNDTGTHLEVKMTGVIPTGDLKTSFWIMPSLRGSVMARGWSKQSTGAVTISAIEVNQCVGDKC